MRTHSGRTPWWPGAWIAGSLVFAVLLAGGAYWLGRTQGQAAGVPLPVLGQAPDYTLTNQLGQPVRSAQFSGKVQVVTFLFPYCTTVCPLIAAHLTNFMRQEVLPTDLADRVQLVAFNVDPAHTGPPEMRAFLAQYGWDTHDLHWQYLVGDPQAVRRVVTEGFRVDYRRASGEADRQPLPGDIVPVQPEVENALARRAHVDYDIVHNDVIELVDPQGRIRKIYTSGDTVGPDRLARDVRALLGLNAPGAGHG